MAKVQTTEVGTTLAPVIWGTKIMCGNILKKYATFLKVFFLSLCVKTNMAAA
jgi:hypothetical protein